MLLARTALLLALLAAPPAWRLADPEHAWSFPRDHHAHPDHAIEWWYFTGHLAATADPERRFGYQFTLFRVGLTRAPAAPESAWSAGAVAMGHFALVDLARGEHVFSETLVRESPLLAGFPPVDDERIAWCAAPPGSAGDWTLRRVGDGFAFAAHDDARGIALELEVTPEKPLVFHGPNGWSRKNASGSAASLYYSATRLAARGVVGVGGERIDVAGASWMDREFSSSQLDAQQVGWDWFSLQLDDGRELMLYVLRGVDGRVDHAQGTLVGPDGVTRMLEGSAFAVEGTRRWTSGVTGVEYPVGWRVVVPGEGLDLDVWALVEAQENVSRVVEGLRYWEGAVGVRSGGRVVGRGYVELTGYGEDARLPL